jgi:hypothetical protein
MTHRLLQIRGTSIGGWGKGKTKCKGRNWVKPQFSGHRILIRILFFCIKKQTNELSVSFNLHDSSVGQESLSPHVRWGSRDSGGLPTFIDVEGERVQPRQACFMFCLLINSPFSPGLGTISSVHLWADDTFPLDPICALIPRLGSFRNYGLPQADCVLPVGQSPFLG